MARRFVLFSLLVTDVQAFAPAPLRWGGLPGRSLYLTPNSPPNRALVLPSAMMISDKSDKLSHEEVPHFAIKPDNTIAWDEDLCLEAAGDHSGDVIRINHCTGESKQLWDFVPTNHGHHNLLQLKGSSRCIDVKDVGGVDGAPVVLRECDMNKLAESWVFQGPARHPEYSFSNFKWARVDARLFYGASILGLGIISVTVWLLRHSKAHLTLLKQHGSGCLCDVCCQGGVAMCAPLTARQGSARKMIPAAMALSPTQDQPAKTLQQMPGGAILSEADEQALLAASTFPIAPDDLIAKCKEVIMKQTSIQDAANFDESIYADDFRFIAPFVGGPTPAAPDDPMPGMPKKQFISSLRNFDLLTAFPDMDNRYHRFYVDPFEPNRVWFQTRCTATHTGELMGKPPTGKSLTLPPQAFSMVFNEQGQVSVFNVGYVIDRAVGNTGGLGGAFGFFWATGNPLPIPECQPFKGSFALRGLGVLQKLLSKLPGGGN